ncbi:MAG: type II secretion system F family protein [Chloroflexi bacterium]|nr:type II secretion system F family protein [Chloroflexota bacterium]
MQYSYVAYNSREGVVKGRLEADTEEEVRSQVIDRGYKLLRTHPAWQPPSREKLFPSFYKVKDGDLIRFTRQMATMVASGAPLQQTLDMLQSESKNQVMQRIIGDVGKTVDEGGTLSFALGKHSDVFGPLFISIVQVGELTGSLAPALDQLAEMMEQARDAKQRVMSTLMMPVFNIGIAGLMVMVNIFVVMPPLFENFDEAEIPFMMKMAIGLTDALKNHPIAIFGALMAIGGTLFMLPKIRAVSFWIDTVKLRVPMIGPFIVAGELARFSRTMGLLLESGVALADSLELAINGCGNAAVRREFARAQESLVTGHGLTEALRGNAVIPRMWVELANIGEQSNTLGQSMNDLAATYQKRVEDQLGTVLAILDPVSTLAVGGVVLFLAMSMMQPILAQMEAMAPP